MGFADLTSNSSPSSNWTEAQIVLEDNRKQ